MSERTRYQEAVVVMMALLALVTVLVVCMTPLRAQDLRALGMQVVGPREVLADSVAAVRVIVTDHAARKPAQGALVSIRLAKPDNSLSELLLNARADGRGTVDMSFEIPAVVPGAYEFVIRARYGGDTEETRQAVRVTAGNQVLLTTDKPLYKPTQVVHVRALALRKPSLRALKG
ncbi:MAG: hypothetical protein LLG01_18040, partial [Planctomycetaceae bacterium]|nr:hypothetical protein [Planctomycetaceae bacterium]